MRSFIRYKRTRTVFLLPLSILTVYLASSFPSVTERVYSSGIYPVFTAIFGRLSSLIRFSLAEWLIILFIGTVLTYIVWFVVKFIRCREQRGMLVHRLVATIICGASLGYFVFTLFCGLNYHRESFATLAGLETAPSSVEQLTGLCTELAQSVNEARGNVQQDENGVMISSFDSNYLTAEQARLIYSDIVEDMPMLGGYTVLPKPVMMSHNMSWLDITGVYTPFTFESNVNVDTPDLWVPCTIMHELAHSKGFMRESEANYIAYLTCISSDNPDFIYSGNVLAFIHSSNSLYSADKEAYSEIYASLSDEVKADLKANYQYWDQFKGPVAKVSSTVNDVYLRTNNQQSGVKSYGEMVDLLLAEYNTRGE